MQFEITNEYQEHLKTAWVKFINNERFDYSFIRPEIMESWRVSRYYNVDPYNLTNERLSDGEMKVLWQRHADLMEIARPEIEKLYSIISDSNVYIILTNNEGIVLESKGDKKNLLLSGPYTRLIPGSSWNIADAGTNSISLCLATKKPGQVYGDEHYRYHYKTHTCSGAPIFSINGHIIGTINISGLRDQVNSHTLGAVVTTAQAIENSLKLRSAAMELAKIENSSSGSFSFLDSIGLILLNHENRVMYINPRALQMLRMEETDAVGQPFTDIVRIENNANSKTKAFLHFKDNIYDLPTDLSLVNESGVRLHKNLSVHRINNFDGLNYVTVLTLSESRNDTVPVKVKVESQTVSAEFKTKYKFTSIIGSSSVMLRMIHEARNASRNTSNILITGESGTGKELFAQAIHSGGNRKEGPFVAINCGAIPHSLVESELFGYEQGAFTGGKKGGSPGKFELANGGTLFLDEIGEMPLDIQVSLLRVLENHEIVRLGGSKNISIDVRIIAATNKDLFQAVQDKTFREDLYYRLNVLLIHIPPLRDRRNDIIELLHTFVNQHNDCNENIIIGENVCEALLNYAWPGNIRELSNVVERAMLIREGNVIALEHLPMNIQVAFHNKHVLNSVMTPELIKMRSSSRGEDGSERVSLINALTKTAGNVENAAQLLDLNTRTLYRQLKKNSINPKEYKK